MTQFGRALHALNIDIICANSSPAKGRVKRANRTLQDRLVEELRLAGAATLADGNALLPAFTADYNARFAKAPANSKDLHRRLGPGDDLEDAFAWKEERTLSQALTLQYDKILFILEPVEHARAAIGKRVTVVDYPDGRLSIRYKGIELAYRTFDKIQQVDQGAIVENKRLGAALTFIREEQLRREPEEDLLIILRRALFAWLIADGDMHLKNMALLKIAEPGDTQFRSVRMAPLYDAVTTRVFPRLRKDRLALKLNGKDDRLRRADFRAFAGTAGLKAADADAAIDEMSGRLGEAIGRIGMPKGLEYGAEGRKMAKELLDICSSRIEFVCMTVSSGSRRLCARWRLAVRSSPIFNQAYLKAIGQLTGGIAHDFNPISSGQRTQLGARFIGARVAAERQGMTLDAQEAGEVFEREMAEQLKHEPTPRLHGKKVPDYLRNPAPLVEMIKSFWLRKGHKIDIRLKPFQGGGGGVEIKSSLRNGLPPSR